jgi:5'-nucleotidase
VTDEKMLEPDSDVYVLRVERQVSVTPLSLDLTSRVDLAELEKHMRSEMG